MGRIIIRSGSRKVSESSMIRSVDIGGKRFKITANDVLGVGGEATVVKVNNQAVKIYHNPDHPQTQLRIKKLTDFLKSTISLPAGVCAPLSLAFNTQGSPVGFAMNLMSGQNEAVQKLSSKSFRKSNPHLTSKFITELFIDGYRTTASCHRAGVVIGDYNDLNVLFSRNLTFIDADSFQFGKYPCMVGTEHFLDPRLYNLDLSAKPYFSAETDWYAWFCMFIRSLLLVHPYGGVHPKYSLLTQRALQKITFLAPGVKYPKAAFSPDLLNASLKTLFERMFHRGERFIPPIEAWEEYRESLRECLTCHTMFPSDQASCPQCSTVATQQVTRRVRVDQVAKGKVQTEEIFSTPGEFVWCKLYFKTILAIALEKQKYILYRKEPDTEATKTELFKMKCPTKFDMFEGRYLVAKQEVDEDILILDTLPAVLGMTKKPVSLFHSDPVFACSQNSLFRVANGFLYCGQHSMRYSSYTESQVTAVVRNQTWIVADPESDSIFGLQRIFSTLSYFHYQMKGAKHRDYWSEQIVLEDQESVIDAAAYFHGSYVLLLLKTEKQRRTYVRGYVLKHGKTLEQYKVEALSSDVYRSIHGKAFAYTVAPIVLHPTDDGIVQEMPQGGTKNLNVLSATEPFVGETDKLVRYDSGILVCGDKSVTHLTIGA